MPLRVIITEATVADCTKACDLIAGIKADYLLADRGYDADAIVAPAQAQGMEAVIPPRKHRKVQREYDKYLYKLRHLVESKRHTKHLYPDRIKPGMILACRAKRFETSC